MTLKSKIIISALFLVNLLNLPETKAAPLLANFYKLKANDHSESNLVDSKSANLMDSKLDPDEVDSGVPLKEIETLQNELLDVTKMTNAMKKKLRRMIRKISFGRTQNNSLRINRLK